MKKILIITSYLSGSGGMEEVIKRMKLTLKEHVDITVLSLSDGVYVKGSSKPKTYKNWIHDSVYFRRSYGDKKINSLLHFVICFKYLFRKKYDFVITTGPFQTRYISYIKKLLFAKFKIMGWPHFSSTSSFGKFEDFGYADEILCISRGISAQLFNLGLPKEKLKYFPNVFKKRNLVLKKTGDVDFLYIGRIQFQAQKRICDILSAAKGLNDEVEISLIGDGDENDLDLINKFISENHLSKIKVYRGWHDDPWKFASSKSVLLLSSEFEGLPTVIGEALSLGLPVISTNCPTGPSDFIVDNVNGKLFNVRDIDGLESSINDILDNREQYCEHKIKETMVDFYEDKYIERALEIFSSK